MGYMIEQRDGGSFTILAGKHDACLAAIKAIPVGDPHTGNGGGYAWVGEYFKATTIVEAFDEWRWDLYNANYDTPKHGVEDVTGITFSGEKWGDDQILWDAVAPYVEAGSYIEMSGEEGETWRWIFDGSTCRYKEAKLVWED